MPSTDLKTVSFEIAQVSREHVLAVMFPWSKANAYPAVVAICKSAVQYWESDVEGIKYHFAAFGRAHDQITLALAVANYANTMTAARFFARGLPMVNLQALYESLQCFVQSLQCVDVRAHCVTIVRDKDVSYSVPCSFLANRWPAWPFNPDHPSTLQDQFQAMAVKGGCDWCPNFNADRLQPVDAPNQIKGPLDIKRLRQDTMK